MKDKVKTLIGAGLIVGQIFVPTGVVAAAGSGIDSMLVPEDEYGPELYIKQIDPDNQKVYVYYENRGAMKGTFTNMSIFWPRKVEDLRAERVYDEDFEFDFDEMAMDVGRANQWWTGVHYNSNTVKLSDKKAVPVAATWPDTYKLADNPYSVLYTSVEITNSGVRSYWVGKADYSDCMKYYQPGVVCEGQLEDDLAVKYYPYLNGVLIEPEEEPEDNNKTDQPADGGEEQDNNRSDETGENGGNENHDDNDNSNGSTSNVEQDGEKNPVATIAKDTNRVLLAGVGSAVVDSGRATSAATATQSVADTTDDDESAETDQATTEDDTAGNTSDTYEDDTDSVVAVPDLGGSEEKQGNFWLLILGALGVAAVALVAYWWIILPLVKRKKDDEETQE